MTVITRGCYHARPGIMPIVYRQVAADVI